MVSPDGVGGAREVSDPLGRLYGHAQRPKPRKHHEGVDGKEGAMQASLGGLAALEGISGLASLEEVPHMLQADAERVIASVLPCFAALLSTTYPGRACCTSEDLGGFWPPFVW